MAFYGRVRIDNEPGLTPGPSTGFRPCECRHAHHGAGGKAHGIARFCLPHWVPLPTGIALYYLCGECVAREHHRPPSVWTGVEPPTVPLAHPIVCAWCAKEGTETVIGASPIAGSHGICPTHKVLTLEGLAKKGGAQ